MHKVLISKEIPAIAENLLKNEGYLVTTLNSDVSLSPVNNSYLKQELANTDAIISLLSDQIDQEFLNHVPNLKVISNFAVGVNNLDLKSLAANNILVGHTPGVLTEATAELTLGLMLMTSRNLYRASLDVYEGRWKGFEPLGHLGPGLFGKNFGILGLGRIGIKLAEMLKFGFQGNISTISRGEHKDHNLKSTINPAINLQIKNHDDFFSDLDFLILTAPLNFETKNWLNSERLQKLPAKCIVINTGRGELVDQEALYLALKNKKIWAFGTDVTTPEPLPTNHPLLTLSNYTVLPHIGSASIEARTKMAEICAKNIILGLKEKKVLHSPIPEQQI